MQLRAVLVHGQLGIRDIVRTGQELVDGSQPFPRCIKAAPQEMHK